MVRALQAVLPAHALLWQTEDTVPYECDGLTAYRERPLVVALPETEAQVAAVLKACHALGVPVVARGAGTGLSGGAMPHALGVTLSLAKFNRILSIDPRSRTAVVQAGVRNLAISEAAAPHGLYYAPDPSSQIACTIGGNVAENSGGVHCLKYGLTVHNVLQVRGFTKRQVRVILHEAVRKVREKPRGVFGGPIGTASVENRRQREQTQNHDSKIESQQPASEVVQPRRNPLQEPAQRNHQKRRDGDKHQEIPEEPQMLEVEVAGGKTAFLPAHRRERAANPRRVRDNPILNPVCFSEQCIRPGVGGGCRHAQRHHAKRLLAGRTECAGLSELSRSAGPEAAAHAHRVAAAKRIRTELVRGAAGRAGVRSTAERSPGSSEARRRAAASIRIAAKLPRRTAWAEGTRSIVGKTAGARCRVRIAPKPAATPRRETRSSRG